MKQCQYFLNFFDLNDAKIFGSRECFEALQKVRFGIGLDFLWNNNDQNFQLIEIAYNVQFIVG